MKRRSRYLVGAVCVAICTIMVLPIVASVLASVKPTAEAAETPPTYFPHGFSLDAYRRLCDRFHGGRIVELGIAEGGSTALLALLAFDQFFLMTAGQPLNQTATSVFYIYLNTFPFLKLGYGAALSLLLAAFILVFTVTQMVLSRRSHR